MKRLLVISYWVVSILLVAIVLCSLGYRFGEALLFGMLFLPGALAARFFFPKVDFRTRWKGVRDAVFVVLGILVAEIFLFLAAHYYVSMLRSGRALPYQMLPDIPHILTNPVFVAIILTALAAGSHFFEAWLDRRHPDVPGPITFTSDRKPVTLPRAEILYVESNDDATTVVASDGRRFKNYTSISRWEDILGPGFVRIHRSYLVKRSAVTRTDVDLLYLGDDIQLPVSRKYRDTVKFPSIPSDRRTS